jgi:tetratricopeptide (TPR) repeat protein
MKRVTGWLGAVCLTSAIFCAAPAIGQMRVGGDGHAADANPQVGAGGYNTPEQQQGVTGNDITYGNVTGGFAFRGRLPNAFTDPSGFSEPLPGEQLDAFDRDAPGVPTLDHPMMTPNYSGPHTFYSRTDNPTIPTGFVTSNNVSGNYLAAPPPTQQDLSIDLRLGAPLDFNAPLPKPGDLLIPGQVDTLAAANPSNPTPPIYFMASPLYGVRQLQTEMSNASSSTSNNGNPTNPMAQGQTQGQILNPFGTLSRPDAQQQRIMQMRQELVQATQGQQQAAAGGANNSSQPLTPLTPGASTPGNPSQNPNQPLSQLQVSGSTPIAPTVLTPVAGDMSTAPLNNPETQALLPPSAEQSAQLAQLQQRMLQYNKAHPPTDQESNKQFLTDLQTRQGAINPTGRNPGVVTPSVTGGPDTLTVAPGLVAATPAPSAAPPPTPMQIKSMAAGVSSKSLADLLTKAEDQTRKGEYAKSIEAYDEAAAVAPNNALIPLGRANAELGGSYYSQAETDLRSAFKQDNSLLLAQYDLRGLLGAQRLQYVVSDLKQLASDSPQNPTPVFLLAYIAYNTHHEDRAAGWLDVAYRRAGGNDDVIPMLKKYWTFTPSNPATQP